MATLAQINIKNLKAFQKSINDAVKKVGDLRVPMGLIADDFYKSEKAIFMLKSAGGYDELSPKYAERKRRGDSRHRAVPEYPLLKREGRLEDSITQPDGEESIYKLGKKSVIIGTQTPYGAVHQYGSKKKNIPRRMFVFIGPESREFSKDNRFGGRPIRWANIIQRYVEEVLAAKGGA